MACKRRRNTPLWILRLVSPLVALGSSSLRTSLHFGSILGLRGAHHGWQPGSGATTWRRQNTWACADGAGGGGRRLWLQQWRDKDLQHQQAGALGFKSLGGAPTHRNIQVSNFPCMTTRAHIAALGQYLQQQQCLEHRAKARREAGRGRARVVEMLWDMLTCRTSRLACVTSHLCTPHPHTQVAKRPFKQAIGRRRRRGARRNHQPGE